MRRVGFVAGCMAATASPWFSSPFPAASSKSDHAAIDETLADHGRDGFAAAWLERRGLDWAVELLGPADTILETAQPQSPNTPEANHDKETTHDQNP